MQAVSLLCTSVESKPAGLLDVFVVGRDDVRHRPDLGERLAERLVQINGGVHPQGPVGELHHGHPPAYKKHQGQ